MSEKDTMNFYPLVIKDAFAIKMNCALDERGALLRIWESSPIFEGFNLIQASIVHNPDKHTLRGIHYQEEPYSENKIIQCISGKIFDVIIDLRYESSTYGQKLEIELGQSCEFQGILVPARCAHGYLTLETNCTLVYFMDKEFNPESRRGIIWNDSKLQINWPNSPKLISDSDQLWPQVTL